MHLFVNIHPNMADMTDMSSDKKIMRKKTFFTQECYTRPFKKNNTKSCNKTFGTGVTDSRKTALLYPIVSPNLLYQ